MKTTNFPQIIPTWLEYGIARMSQTILLTAFLFCGSTQCCAQTVDKNLHASIATKFEEAFAEKKGDMLFDLLADDFETNGHRGKIARMVLSAIFQQVTIEGNVAVESSSDDGLQFALQAARKGEPEKPIRFDVHLNDSAKISSIELANASAKVIRIAETTPYDLRPDADIEFQLVEGLIVIPGTVNSRNGLFVVDSGARQLVINSARFESDFSSGSSDARGVGGAVQTIGAVQIDSLETGAVKLSKPSTLLAMDLSHIEEGLGLEIFGLVGMKELEPFEVTIDYGTKHLTFSRLSSDDASRTRHDRGIEWMDVELFKHIMVFDCNVGEHVLKMGLDTGAGSNLIQSEVFQKLDSRFVEMLEDDELSGIGTEKETIRRCLIRDCMTLGKKCTPMKFAIQTVDLTQLSSSNLDGLLGYDWLQQFKVVLNYKAKKIGFIDVRGE